MNMNNHHKHRCDDRLEALRALDFAIQDTVLYLDAYPDCVQALEYYHALLEQRKCAMEEYEMQCGPLTVYGNRSKNSWDWTDTPFPWQITDNG